MSDVVRACSTCARTRSMGGFTGTGDGGWICWECWTAAPPAAAQGIQPAPWSRYGQAAAPYYAELQAYLDYMHRQLVLAKSLEQPSFVMVNGAWERCNTSGTPFAVGLPGTVIKFNPPPQGDSMRKTIQYAGQTYTREFVERLVKALNAPIQHFKTGDRVRCHRHGPDFTGIVMPAEGPLADLFNAKYGLPDADQTRVMCVKGGCVGQSYTKRTDTLILAL